MGSIPFGVIAGRLVFGSDIRAAGSGNIGAANALRAFGTGGGLLVLGLDVLKGFVAAFAGLALGGTVLGAAAGLAALLGHCFSPWLGFRGGKAVATHLGVTLALSWPAGLVFIGGWVLAGLTSGYSSAGSLTGTVLAAATLYVTRGPIGLAYGLLAGALIFWRHRENIGRLVAGTENRMSLLKKRKSV